MSLRVPNHVAISDGNEYVKVTRGSLEVISQEKVEKIVSQHFFQQTGTFTLASPFTIDTKVFTANAGHGIVANDFVEFFQDGKFFQGHVLSVATNTITLEQEVDYTFTQSAIAIKGITNMNVNGSSTRQIFSVTPPAGAIWDIIRIIMKIEDNVAMDSSKFGGITALTNGILIRDKHYSNGELELHNLFHAKTNSDLKLEMFDFDYYDKVPSGLYGMACRRTFGGDSKNGSVIELNGDTSDSIEIVISDDLTALIDFEIVAQGHEKLE